jgi:glycosyltransferase involved in cell wall biosynthesis
LAVGRLAPQKGFGTLLSAAASWHDMRPVPHVLIAGEGPLLGQLRDQAATLGVDAEFLGHRDDVPALLAAADVFVLPSHWEGQPLVLQEALRAGAAIVATRTGGIPELAGPGAAYLVTAGDVPQLAAGVRAVLTSQSLAVRLRSAATRRAASLPTQSDAVNAALGAYSQACTRSRSYFPA